MSQTVISVENLYKEYKLGVISHGTLTHDLQSWWARVRGKEDPNSLISTNPSAAAETGSFLALKDINFEVKAGDRVGIIGKNGAGKSTLLKILSKVTAPTKGQVKMKGRVGSLLEVGTGFHSELTGRENIYLNGAILGMRKKEIDRKLDEIVDFAGVEKHIDTPVKRYSSGMNVRLGFAVAAHLEPEILIVDEVLAVGDAEFQKKAIGKMEDVSKGEGRTILFVSHNMAAVQRLCNTGVLLRNGCISYQGIIDNVINTYISDYNEKTIVDIENDIRREGTGDVIFANFYILKTSHEKTSTVMTGEDVSFNFIIKAKKRCKIDLGFSIHNMDGSTITILYSGFQNYFFEVEKGYNLITCLIKDFSFCSPRLRVAGLIKLQDGTISDWPKFGLGEIDIIIGDYYGTGKESHNGIQYLLRGEWNSNIIPNEI